MRDLQAGFDAVVLACGAGAPRDLPVPGRELGGIHFAMEYLTLSNRRCEGDRIDDDRFISGLSDLTEAVHREKVLIATQLHHAGRQNARTNTEGRVGPVAPSAVTSAAIGDEPRALTVDEIAEIVEEFREAAVRSVVAGFDMVEIHGSHGYLLTQFLSPQSNLRTDEYGGSFENRIRLLCEVLAAVRAGVGDDYPLGVRLSADNADHQTTGEDVAQIAAVLEERGLVDFVNLSWGSHWGRDVLMGGIHEPPGYQLQVNGEIARKITLPTIVTGRFG